jgi:nicotinamide-nucleotide amidase
LAYGEAVDRPLLTAEILAVGSELTTGSTRDTNSGDLARELSRLGVDVLRTIDLPDRLDLVEDAFRQALSLADLVVATGGLGPTPDDLTREAIAAACELELRVDPVLERWLRTLFARRGVTMSDANRKQAWLVDGAAPMRNGRGTAPGWWLERPDGRVLVALPGPPGEMWPMWRNEVVPRLAEREVGAERAARTLRLTGIGESVLVPLIGEDVLRAANPQIATYARADAVDVRVSAVADSGRTASELVDQAVAELMPRIGRHVFAEGEEGWPDALGRLLGERRLATVEIGTSGQLAALLGAADFLQYAQLLRAAPATDHAGDNLGLYAERVLDMTGADIGLAVHARDAGDDTAVEVAVATAAGTRLEQRTVFLTGEQGRRRAALAACAVLWEQLREVDRSD